LVLRMVKATMVVILYSQLSPQLVAVVAAVLFYQTGMAKMAAQAVVQVLVILLSRAAQSVQETHHPPHRHKATMAAQRLQLLLPLEVVAVVALLLSGQIHQVETAAMVARELRLQFQVRL